MLGKIVLYLRIIWNSPLLILFAATDQKSLILSDVHRWQEVLNREKKSDLLQLLSLLQLAPEFRNIYYHRLLNGNALGKNLMYILKIIYRQCPYFFLDNSCNIGSGLFIQHGFSTIISADIGDNCWINQQVTIGYKDKGKRPKLGNNVRVTAGAKVLGGITVGDNVTVGANAVVVKDIPPNCVVVGVPAYIVRRDGIKVKESL
ncbi:MAG: 2,3,4,5-tetrahydropyridine-2,6-dicarboxylate N-acetyltransferase [Chroococcopsis gigantea SAG 12.99]|jgi:serine O-acetyltransferase|nr:serine acetyltransferase [Chlorogloea purpurea SAG 13.99]MDV3002302.1 2,3,4,5-tetrahydropyridine-2,6-dicarboxylate N-acetyltransferase [Chroococcopsis gigantea SAG 12.99]